MAKAPPGGTKAAIFGCAGTVLDDWERRFFEREQPFGFILFKRNLEDPDQIRALVVALRASVGRDDAPVLIDQEGGRVQRLGPPLWRAAPPAERFGRLAERDRGRALTAARLNARLIAAELADLGIDVDCAPVLDLRRPETHSVIGDRAYGAEPETVAALGRAVCEGLCASGVMSVVKHLPGHGRATVDSHHALPRVDAGLDELEAGDFEAFRLLRDAPWGMTGHLLFPAIDRGLPATLSRVLIERVIRGSIGFDGLLLSDDLSMAALEGSLGERAAAALAAGCDLALHCNGAHDEMAAVAASVGPLSEPALARIEAAAGCLPETPERLGTDDTPAALDALLDQA